LLPVERSFRNDLQRQERRCQENSI
jgi:hypothetical protein